MRGPAAWRASNQTRVSTPHGACRMLTRMEITHPGAFWLVPVVLSVAFLLWVLWSFWRDARH
jgi:hypothetical protein